MGGKIRIAAWLATAALLSCGEDGLQDAHGRLTVQPEPLYFGVVSVGSELEEELVLQNVGIAPLTILGIEGLDGLPDAYALPAMGEEAFSIRGGEQRSMRVRFRPSEERRYRGSIVIHTDSSRNPRIEVPVDGYGQRPAVACSSSLAFGRVVLNTEKILPVSCVNGANVDATVRVEGIYGEDVELFSLVDQQEEITVKAGETGLIMVRFSALRLGAGEARLHLALEGMETPTAEVDLSGEGYASSLVAAPSCLHFGAVGPGGEASRSVIVANGGDRPVRFDGPRIVDASGVFELATTTVEGNVEDLVALDPGEQATVTVSFSPRTIGRYTGTLRLRNDDPIGSHLDVCLTGTGGGADIRVTPSPLDFGTIATGMAVSKRVEIRNVGTSDGGPLRVTGLSVSGAGFSAPLPAEIVLEPSDPPAIVEVSFRPESEGPHVGTLLVTSNDGDEPSLPVPLLGQSEDLAPCVWEAMPPALRFTQVQVGSETTLVTNLRNVGEEACVFASPRLASPTSPRFELPQDTFSVETVAPRESVSIAVRFRADRVGGATGTLAFDVSDPSNPVGTVPLSADVIDGCLVATPAGVDFGLRRVSCPAAAAQVRLHNQCLREVTIHTAGLGASSGEGELSFGGLSTPQTVGAGANRTLSFFYDPVDDGHDAALFELTSSEHPLSIPVYGRGTTVDERTDVFRQQDRSPVDLLFVIDNSGSMSDKQRAVANGLDDFMQYAIDQGIDFHIGVTTTGVIPSTGGWVTCPGGADGGEAGRLYPVSGVRPRIVTSDMSNAASIFGQNVQVGTCHWLEQGLEAAFLALSSPLVDNADDTRTSTPNDGNEGFYRPEARLSVVILSDEDDQSKRPTSFYTSFFNGLKGAGRAGDVSVNAVVGKGCGYAAEEGRRYLEVVDATGGMSEPICTDDWADSLARLAEQTFGYQLSFPLTGVPEGAVEVEVNGSLVTTGWVYDRVRNAVVFTEDTAPSPGSEIRVTYTPSC